MSTPHQFKQGDCVTGPGGNGVITWIRDGIIHVAWDGASIPRPIDSSHLTLRKMIPIVTITRMDGTEQTYYGPE